MREHDPDVPSAYLPSEESGGLTEDEDLHHAPKLRLPSDRTMNGAAPELLCIQLDDLGARIHCVSARLFAEHGYAGTSIREVAERAGCTKPAVYYYYQNKAALYLGVLERAVAGFDAIIESTKEGSGTLGGRLRLGMTSLFEFVRQHPDPVRVLMRAEMVSEGQPAFDFRGVRERHLALTRALIDKAIEDGELSADVDVEMAMLSLMGMVDTTLRLYVSGGEPIPEGYADRIVRHFLRGVS